MSHWIDVSPWTFTCRHGNVPVGMGIIASPRMLGCFVYRKRCLFIHDTKGLKFVEDGEL